MPGMFTGLAQRGRYGDTELAHVNPQEKAMLRAMGGSGSINPETGLREYYSGLELNQAMKMFQNKASKKGPNSEMWGEVDPDEMRSNMMQGMPTGEFEGLADQYGEAGTNYLRSSSELMSGQSPILAAMRQKQAGALGDIGAQQNMQQSRALAARGMGGGGLRSALGQGTAAQLGEQASQGVLGIQKYGLEDGAQMGQLGMEGLAGQGNALGSLGAMHSQANQAQNATIQTNAANKASYLQAEAARKRAAKRRSGGLLGGIVGGALGFVTGGPAGAKAGYAIGSSVGGG